MDRLTELDEGVNTAFVLCSSLYFRLAGNDRSQQDPVLIGWAKLLHDTARDLSSLSESWSDAEIVPAQLSRGVSDVIHSLRDLADLAQRTNQPKLSTELESYADGLDARRDLRAH